MTEVIYPDVNSLWDALTADWGAAGTYGLAIEQILGFVDVEIGTIITALGAEFDGTPDLYDVLVTGGIPAWPAAAAPANNISLAQVIREIFNDVTGLAGAAMRGTDGAALVASGWDAGLATILDNFTALRITDLDNLANLPGAEVAGTFSYLDAGGEQTIFTITTATRLKLHSVFIDLNTLTQDTTIRVHHAIDSANYRVIETIDWLVATDDKGVYFNKALAINQNFAISMEEGADEGAARAIPYYYITEVME